MRKRQFPDIVLYHGGYPDFEKYSDVIEFLERLFRSENQIIERFRFASELLMSKTINSNEDPRYLILASLLLGGTNPSISIQYLLEKARIIRDRGDQTLDYIRKDLFKALKVVWGE